MMFSQLKIHTIKWIRASAWVYFTIIFAWAAAHLLLGDHPWWLFGINALSVYLFFPLPLIVLIAFIVRRRDTWLGTLFVFALAVFLYGKVYLPWRTAFIPEGPSITVMTYNILGFNEHVDAVINVIQSVDADLVSLQELNPVIARAIKQKLSSKYPYQQLDPQVGVTGSGVISRYPLKLSDEKLPGNWVGTPQILSLTFAGKSITILQAHTFSTDWRTSQFLEQTITDREQQARIIKDFAQTHPGALIVPLDFNSTTQNTSYQIVTTLLSDAWMEAGWGLGHTFPAMFFSGGFKPNIAGIDPFTWFARIDYIFYSRHFRAADAHIGPWDGYSDHRPVVARLVLVDH